MKLIWILGIFITLPVFPAQAQELRLEGIVPPTLDFSVEPFGGGFTLRNLGNALALFQVAPRGKTRKSERLEQSHSAVLQTDYLEHAGKPVEIRILAP